MTAPSVILFDVIETLFSLAPLKDRFARHGLPESDADLFFAQLLRDAFALSAAGVFKPFPEIASGSLRVLLEDRAMAASDDTVKALLAVFAELPPHPDVRPALERVRQSATCAVLLTNGSRANTEQLLGRAGLDGLVDDVLSVEDFGVWKPKLELYQGACRKMGIKPGEATLIAAHAWDVHGALSAGLRGVWVRRQDSRYHPAMGEPAGLAHGLSEAVDIALG